ncbi:nicotinate-nucleotide adenylyltransferase [Chloroflexota bacterium]
MTEDRLGILGGTFDPIHRGHLIIADEVRQQMGLREVLFIPAGQPWLKGQEVVSSGEHRLQMVKLAVAANPCFKVSTIELECPGPTYSIDTMLKLRSELGAGVEMFMILGFDALAELPRWREPERLLKLCKVLGVGRPGYSEFNLQALEHLIPGAAERITIIDMHHIDISASDIRRRVVRGLSIRHLVPEAVEMYILEQGLYREGGFDN